MSKRNLVKVEQSNYKLDSECSVCDDCFNCPLPDCIWNIDNRVKKDGIKANISRNKKK